MGILLVHRSNRSQDSVAGANPTRGVCPEVGTAVPFMQGLACHAVKFGGIVIVKGSNGGFDPSGI